MKKKILNKKAGDRENKKGPMFEENITNFINRKEETLDLIDAYEDLSVPVMMRIDKFKVAILDHLAERWRTTRSGLACEILEEMISAIFQKLYKEKTDEELRQLYHEIVDDFDKKKKVSKKKKG
ncbi:MAG: hypothetical protein CVU62_02370 [Deltaproteobacteria bacterium HGW-Deltaproteobacteria-2]|nr:MAG: hypothetical protein CVU62_02370 [Deltaproteobacteria bacterium HGW-Deltaproteobacteria-2]